MALKIGAGNGISQKGLCIAPAGAAARHSSVRSVRPLPGVGLGRRVVLAASSSVPRVAYRPVDASNEDGAPADVRVAVTDVAAPPKRSAGAGHFLLYAAKVSLIAASVALGVPYARAGLVQASKAGPQTWADVTPAKLSAAGRAGVTATQAELSASPQGSNLLVATVALSVLASIMVAAVEGSQPAVFVLHVARAGLLAAAVMMAVTFAKPCVQQMAAVAPSLPNVSTTTLAPMFKAGYNAAQSQAAAKAQETALLVGTIVCFVAVNATLSPPRDVEAPPTEWLASGFGAFLLHGSRVCLLALVLAATYGLVRPVVTEMAKAAPHSWSEVRPAAFVNVVRAGGSTVYSELTTKPMETKVLIASVALFLLCNATVSFVDASVLARHNAAAFAKGSGVAKQPAVAVAEVPRPPPPGAPAQAAASAIVASVVAPVNLAPPTPAPGSGAGSPALALPPWARLASDRAQPQVPPPGAPAPESYTSFSEELPKPAGYEAPAPIAPLPMPPWAKLAEHSQPISPADDVSSPIVASGPVSPALPALPLSAAPPPMTPAGPRPPPVPRTPTEPAKATVGSSAPFVAPTPPAKPAAVAPPKDAPAVVASQDSVGAAYTSFSTGPVTPARPAAPAPKAAEPAAPAKPPAVEAPKPAPVFPVPVYTSFSAGPVKSAGSAAPAPKAAEPAPPAKPPAVEASKPAPAAAASKDPVYTSFSTGPVKSAGSAAPAPKAAEPAPPAKPPTAESPKPSSKDSVSAAYTSFTSFSTGPVSRTGSGAAEASKEGSKPATSVPAAAGAPTPAPPAPKQEAPKPKSEPAPAPVKPAAPAPAYSSFSTQGPTGTRQSASLLSVDEKPDALIYRFGVGYEPVKYQPGVGYENARAADGLAPMIPAKGVLGGSGSGGADGGSKASDGGFKASDGGSKAQPKPASHAPSAAPAGPVVHKVTGAKGNGSSSAASKQQASPAPKAPAGGLVKKGKDVDKEPIKLVAAFAWALADSLGGSKAEKQKVAAKVGVAVAKQVLTKEELSNEVSKQEAKQDLVKEVEVLSAKKQ